MLSVAITLKFSEMLAMVPFYVPTIFWIERLSFYKNMKVFWIRDAKFSPRKYMHIQYLGVQIDAETYLVRAQTK